MLTHDGWFDWATRKPGIADKTHGVTNAVNVYIPHSAVGYWPGFESRMWSTEKTGDGRYTDYAAASVHGWIPYSGEPKDVIQLYSVFDSCWSSGKYAINSRAVAFENEGGAPGRESEALTDFQLTINALIIADLITAKIFPENPRRPVDAWQVVHDTDNTIKATPDHPIPTHPDMDAQLYEHRECVRFGSLPTACPSWRINWDEIMRRVGVAETGGVATPLPGRVDVEAPYVYIENGGIRVLAIGSADGRYPGQISKLFGDRRWWLSGDWAHPNEDGSFPVVWKPTASD